MKDIFKKYKLELTSEELEKFNLFLEIFKEKNSKLNLSAIREEKAIVEKHFVDSLMINIFFDFDKKTKVWDLWTGWGFPLIPLAIVNKEVDFVWIDSVWKKIKAIEEFREKLWLENIKTINSRAEELWNDLEQRESFDVIVSRATAFLPVLIEYALPLLKVWWILASYKLDDKDEIKKSKKALKKLWARIIKVKNYKLDSSDRVIIFIEKLEKTNKKYPRRNWEALKKPLV